MAVSARGRVNTSAPATPTAEANADSHPGWGAALPAPGEPTLSFRDVFESAPVAMAYFYADGRLYALNGAFRQLCGYGEGDLPDALMWFELAYPDAGNRDDVVGAIPAVISSMSGNSYRRLPPLERWLTRKDGSEFLAVVSGGPFRSCDHRELRRRDGAASRGR